MSFIDRCEWRDFGEEIGQTNSIDNKSIKLDKKLLSYEIIADNISKD